MNLADLDRASATRREPQGRQAIGLLPLVASTYFMVSGGAYGLEELLAYGYPIALTALLVTPLVWSLPTALLVGELASALPDEGGYYAWVRRALGPFWGFQEAWLSLLASVFDMAIYPTLFTLYLGKLWPAAEGGAASIAVGSGLIVACALWNLGGAANVGRGAVLLGLLLLAPFAAFVGLAVVHWASKGGAPTSPLATSASASGGLTGVLVALWNYMGWDNASTIAQEVRDPGKTYPRAVLATLVLVVASYVLPVAAGALAGVSVQGFHTGSWVTAARAVGGAGLALAIVVGGMICGVGMYNSLLLAYSRVPAALAAQGDLPAVLGRRLRGSNVPWVSVCACSVAYAACLGLGFPRLVALDVLLYGASLSLEFLALVVLRVREPGLVRPFRVPGGAAVAGALSVLPLSLVGISLWECRGERVAGMPSLGFASLLVLGGPLVYGLRRRFARGASPPTRPLGPGKTASGAEHRAEGGGGNARERPARFKGET